MISVEILYESNHLKKMIVKGHANSDVYGKDLVCSAVSGIIIGGLNNLNNPKDYNITTQDGFVEIISIKCPNNHDCIVFETIIVQLKTIDESYSKYIQIMEKGN